MITSEELKKEFRNHGGIMRTAELNGIGLDSRKISRLIENNILNRIKTGVYEFADISVPDEVMISRMFPTAVIYLESALFHYGYTNRIPASWQIAVDRNIAKSQFKIAYPPITPFYLDKKYIDIGIDEFNVDGVKVRIYNKERTICDVLRYANKLDKEVFNNSIKKYINDKDKNMSRLIEYSKKLRVFEKVKTYVGVWL